jgi:putative endonuclease
MDSRLNQHQSGYNPGAYTYTRRPVQLVFNQVFDDINEAIRFEKRLKTWSRKKKQALIKGDWERLPLLAKKKNFKR